VHSVMCVLTCKINLSAPHKDMTTTTKYMVGHYDAPPRDTPATLPLMVRAEFVCASQAEACEQCVKSATADTVKLSEGKQPDLLVEPAVVGAGYHARWIKTMDDYPPTTEEGEVALPTHRTLCLFYARPKQRWVWGTEYAGTSRPVRFYFVSTVQAKGETRVEHNEDDATLRSSASSDSSDNDAVCPVKDCTRGGTVHFHARRRPRPRK
jgi:hypothetical protein